MKKEQMDRGSSACDTNPDSAECARELSKERMINKDCADHNRAEYLQLHDDDEAELELPR